jgi:Glycosyltransferase
LESEWFREPRRPIHPVVRTLYDIKVRKRPFTILYFLWHSGWRKGADLVAALMDCIERAKIDYMLVVKKMDITDPAFKLLTKYRMFVVEGRLARDWLIDLYDLADLVLLPSRGGSFEMSGLEALGRGVPVLMPNVGTRDEYTPPGLERYLHVKTARMVEPLPGNQIHSGKGAEWDPEDACLKFIEIYTNYDEVKARTVASIEWIRKNYSWDAVEEKSSLPSARSWGTRAICARSRPLAAGLCAAAASLSHWGRLSRGAICPSASRSSAWSAGGGRTSNLPSRATGGARRPW